MKFNKIFLKILSVFLCIIGVMFGFSAEHDIYTRLICCVFCIFFGFLNLYALKDI